ncbi:hypothetical protein EDD18DRAFT_1117594 [Armillaria luteobubalina]|uniref:Uncharacterized protein n=1 Tax=Armillaria luteobubalina TaxID=153913 RepID=A0AA39U8I7_9AGAR|nr:hypothetical protein EDD18DRAFT_1117594 [Armillaria luteobubalina]
MNIDEFAAGVAPLRTILDPEQRAENRPRDIASLLSASSPFLVHILSLARRYPTHPAAPFIRDLIFSCENITAELPHSAQLDCFDEWGLHMNELARCACLSSNTPLPKGFCPQPAKLQGKKRRASAMDDDDELVGEGASDDEAADEGSDDRSDVEDEPVAKGKGKAKAPACGQSSTKAATLHLNQALKTSAPKPKAAGTKKTSSGLNIILPRAPTSKTKIAKTQPGSVKEEPDATSLSSRKPRAAKTVRASVKAPSGSSSRPTGRSSVMVKNKKHAVLQTHVYDKEGPVPVKTEELGAVTQASALPSYGCAQCSSSIQNQACLFLGWGKKCNNFSKANSSAGSPAESLAEGDEVQGNLDELESSPARPVKGESASAD